MMQGRIRIAPHAPGAHAAPKDRAPRLGALRTLVALQGALLPALGIPAFFRNEAGWHYLLWQRMGFLELFDGFLTSRSSMGNHVVSRPLVRVLEWLQVRIFGLHSSWYVAVNGAFFVFFALSLFELGLRAGGAGAAVLAILLLVGCYQIVFYPVLNAIHGLQYPLEMLLCTASLVFFVDGFSGRPRRVGAGIVAALLAFVSHAASAIVIPLAVAALALGNDTWPRRRRLLVATLSPLAVSVAFLIERQGVPGGLASQPGFRAMLDFAWAQFATLGTLSLKPPGGPLLAWAFVHGAAVAVLPAAWGGARLVLGTLPVALAMVVASRSAPGPVLGVLLIALLAGVARTRGRWYLAVWALTGVLLFLATPERNASYARHFIVPALVVTGCGLASMFRACLQSSKPLGARIAGWRLEWLALGATLAIVLAVVASTRLPIPGLSNRIIQVRYVGDLGLNFRRGLESLLEELPPGASVGFFAGRSRSEEMRSLYGEDYFARLQPAKSEHYDDFTAMLGRPDVQVRLVDPETGPIPAGEWFFAANAWEVDRARGLCGCEPLRAFERGRARAAMFRPAPSD